ncbi:hypothetical protein FA014_01905 [Cellulomonas hominis]|uniref:Tail terminator n=1 Tax=Cellulomonas hominis TaxID=156981 RepID=A0A7Z8NR76_9CELL|nr:minor capsid protein [Cellulomonas hominis]TKR27135.1 hypothetical protein FA014_01905 [Cellulomonas hominis]
MTEPTVATVAVALVEHLDASTSLVWRPQGSYAAGDHALTIKAVPASPDVVCSVTVYDVDDDPDPRQVRRTFAVQLRFRAASRPDAVDQVADEVFAVLHARHHTRLGGIRVARCARVSVAPLGPDNNGRHERTDNYRIVTRRGGTP